jgi:hypothetical protein
VNLALLFAAFALFGFTVIWVFGDDVGDLPLPLFVLLLPAMIVMAPFALLGIGVYELSLWRHGRKKPDALPVTPGPKDPYLVKALAELDAEFPTPTLEEQELVRQFEALNPVPRPLALVRDTRGPLDHPCAFDHEGRHTIWTVSRWVPGGQHDEEIVTYQCGNCGLTQETPPEAPAVHAECVKLGHDWEYLRELGKPSPGRVCNTCGQFEPSDALRQACTSSTAAAHYLSGGMSCHDCGNRIEVEGNARCNACGKRASKRRTWVGGPR